jgi:hypothetical protein
MIVAGLGIGRWPPSRIPRRTLHCRSGSVQCTRALPLGYGPHTDEGVRVRILDLRDFAEHADPQTISASIHSRDRLNQSPAYVLRYSRGGRFGVVNCGGGAGSHQLLGARASLVRAEDASKRRGGKPAGVAREATR